MAKKHERNLSEQQKKMADEFIIRGNKYESAIAAGYSEKTARNIASENLTKPNIVDYIKIRTEKAIEEAEKDAIASKQEILEFFTKQMRREEREQIVSTTSRKDVNYDEEGRKVEVSTKDPVVIEVKTKNSDAIKAATVLAEHYGMLTGIENEKTNEYEDLSPLVERITNADD